MNFRLQYMRKYIKLSNIFLLSLVYCKKKLTYKVNSEKFTCLSTLNKSLKITNSTKTDVIFTCAWCEGMVAKQQSCRSTAPANKLMNECMVHPTSSLYPSINATFQLDRLQNNIEDILSSHLKPTQIYNSSKH